MLEHPAITSPFSSWYKGQACAEQGRICQYPILISRTRRKMYEGAARFVHESVDPWKTEFVFYFFNVILVRKLTLRTVRQFCDDSIHCCNFCGSNHGKISTGHALLISYVFSRINGANWCHLSRLTKKTEGQ